MLCLFELLIMTRLFALGYPTLMSSLLTTFNDTCKMMHSQNGKLHRLFYVVLHWMLTRLRTRSSVPLDVQGSCSSTFGEAGIFMRFYPECFCFCPGLLTAAFLGNASL